MKKNKLFGFTLAETLITLAIIGVVAALTVPTLMKKYQDKVTVTSVKKAYSIFQDAFKSAVAEHGTPDLWYTGSENYGMDVLNTLAPYLKTIKICGEKKGCASSDVYKTMSGQGHSYAFGTDIMRKKALLADGTILFVQGLGHNCQSSQAVCAWLAIDINGAKKPNRFGYDFFVFNMKYDSITPSGIGSGYYEGANDGGWSGCNRNSTKQENGGGCAAWVILKENLDYKYKDGTFTFK